MSVHAPVSRTLKSSALIFQVEVSISKAGTGRGVWIRIMAYFFANSQITYGWFLSFPESGKCFLNTGIFYF